MQTFTVYFTSFDGKGQKTIVRGENGSKVFVWCVQNIPTLNPRKLLRVIPADSNHCEPLKRVCW